MSIPELDSLRQQCIDAANRCYREEGRDMNRTTTVWILIAVVAGLIAWDIAVYLGAGTEATISRVVLDFAGQHPVVGFLLGVISGHWLWPMRARK